MTSDCEFIAFINHAIQLTLVLTTYPNMRTVLLILLETQDVNTSLCTGDAQLLQSMLQHQDGRIYDKSRNSSRTIKIILL